MWEVVSPEKREQSCGIWGTMMGNNDQKKRGNQEEGLSPKRPRKSRQEEGNDMVGDGGRSGWGKEVSLTE